MQCKIKQLRLKYGREWSQAELAKRYNDIKKELPEDHLAKNAPKGTQQLVSRMENRNIVFDIRALWIFAVALGVQLGDLLEYSDDDIKLIKRFWKNEESFR